MLKKLDFRLANCGIQSLKSLDLEELKFEYNLIVNDLIKKYPETLTRTKEELKFATKLAVSSGLEVFHSFWIGSYCFDFFIPSVGIVIEIDGEIHDKEFKGKVDQSKMERVSQIGIYLYSIENTDLQNKCVLALLKELSKLKKRDSRGKKRLLRNIYLLTIISNRRDQDLIKIFSDEDKVIISNIRKYLCL